MNKFFKIYTELINESKIKKEYKGTVEYTTYSVLTFIKQMPFNNFTVENVLKDCNKASVISGRKDEDGNPLHFIFLREYERNEYGTIRKVIEIKAENWRSIHWWTLTSDDPKDKEIADSWNNFWDELKKLGYNIKM